MKKTNLIIAILFISLITSLTGCSFSNEKATMEEIILSNWKSKNSYDNESFMGVFDEYSTFIVSDVDEEMDFYIVKCRVTSPNILEKLEEYQNSVDKVIDEEEINSIIKELISSSDLETSEQIVKVYKTEEEFIVEYSDGFVDAMYGYSYLYCREQINNMMKTFFE